MTTAYSGNASIDLERVSLELRAREPLFHHPEFGITRAELEEMITPDYWEVGASGKVYDRQFVIDTIVARYEDPEYQGVNSGTEKDWTVEDFNCAELSSGLYLVTYTLTQGERVTRRTTIWTNKEKGFQAVYHQGTIVS